MGSTNRDKKGIRYSDKEKKILYNLFKQYEEIIDIKQRKNTQYKLTEVRECWQNILNTFNSYHGTTTRNLKQIQKFWLNSRLRTRNSSIDDSQKPDSTRKRKTSVIKAESSCNGINDTNESERYDSSNNNSCSGEEVYAEEVVLELKQEALKQAEQNSVSEDDEENDDKNNVDVNEDEDDGSIDGDQDSTDIVIERKKSSRTYKSKSRRHALRRNHSSYTIEASTQTKTKNSTDILGVNNLITQSTLDDNNSNFDSQMNLLKLQEYECKIKESQMRCDQQRIEILKAQEELEHLKELNRLKVKEMQLKIIILEEQTKIRRNRI